MIAEKWNISRDDLDKISGLSHENAADAIKKGIEYHSSSLRTLITACALFVSSY